MPRKKSQVAIQVEKDHEGLHQDIGTLKVTMMKESSDKDFPNWRLEFIWLLQDFRNHLQKHFDLEEEGGFMKEVLSLAPQSENKVNLLMLEHNQFMTDLDGILSDLNGMQQKNTERLDFIRDRLTNLIAMLRRHEEVENQLMQSAYNQEYGGPA